MSKHTTLNRLRPLSFSSYAFIFIGFSVLVFYLLGWISFDETEELQKQIEQKNEKVANQELSDSVIQAVEQIRQLASSWASRDKVKQQLAGPPTNNQELSLYPPGSGTLPKYISASALYNAGGKLLGSTQPSKMPPQIDISNPAPYLILNQSRLYLHTFAPITNNNTVAGYFGVRADFIKALRDLGHFRFLDSTTLATPDTLKAPISLQNAHQLIIFNLQPNPETDRVQRFIESIVYRMAIVGAALSIIFYLMGTALLARPLRHLSEHIDNLKQSQGGLILEKFPFALPVIELEKTRQSLNDYQYQLDKAHGRLDEKNKELWDLAHHDPLTALLNRRAFDNDWDKIRAITTDQRFSICFVIFDCDHFKAINDTYGHETADKAIKAMAACIASSLRKGDKLYRLGGDEFVTILLNCSEEQARKVAERGVQQTKQFDFFSLGIKEPIRISAGISHAKGTNVEDLNDLQWQSNVAMHYAKRPGNDQIAIYSENKVTGSESLFSTWTTRAVYEAITSGNGIEMHYQPVVRLSSGRPEYYEALVRIRRDNTLILPSNLFPIVEARRLETDLDQAILTSILKDLQAGKIPSSTGVSINISGPTVIRQDIIDKLKPFLPYMPHYKFILEVTETSLITHLDKAANNLKQLQEIGFIIALDDFGSGYSSLRYLTNMPVNVIKFDISMVRCLEENEQQRVIVENLAKMISQAGYQLVAEGIENDSLLEQVIKTGFHFGQGFYYGRPAWKIKQDSQAVS